MKKNAVVKGICSLVFVAAAGIFYLCASKTSGEEKDAEVILQKKIEMSSDKGEIFFNDEEKKDAKDMDSAESLSERVAGEKESIYVHVCGAVNTPGVYTLPVGSRIADAVLCAGDFSPDAAKDYLNLAKPVLDGQKIYVPNEVEAERILEEGSLIGMLESGENPSYLKDSGDKESETGNFSYVNLNMAGTDELMTLPGIGKTKADAILAYRAEHGAFTSCEELMQVPGIKQSVYEKIRDNITVGN